MVTIPRSRNVAFGLNAPKCFTEKAAKLANTQPSMQRLYIGATALVTQTALDYGKWTNPYADDNTRKNCATRTFAKMIVTTGSGVLARTAGEWLGRNGLKKGLFKVPEGFENVIEKAYETTEAQKSQLISMGVKLEEIADKTPKQIQHTLTKKKYPAAIGAMAGVAMAVVSVFVADMLFIDPITNWMLDKCPWLNKNKKAKDIDNKQQCEKSSKG